MSFSDSPPQSPQNLNKNPNRARDHLANERTYLAWIRTAVSLMGFGVVIARLRFLFPAALQNQARGWELGLLFALVGLVMVVFSTVHYFHVQNALEADFYQPARRWIVVCSLVIALLGAGVIYSLTFSPGVSKSSGALMAP